MKRRRALAALCILATGLMLWPGFAAAAGIEFDIVALGGSGVTGSGNLEPASEAPTEKTVINLNLAGLQPGSEHLNRIHDGASCSDVGAVAFALANIVADASGKASVTTTLATSTQVFAEAPHLIIVHAGSTLEADPTPIACAVLPAAEQATGHGNPPGIGVAPPSTGSGGLLHRGGNGIAWEWLALAAGCVLIAGGFASRVRNRSRRRAR